MQSQKYENIYEKIGVRYTRLSIIIGTRPEIIKMSPVMREKRFGLFYFTHRTTLYLQHGQNLLRAAGITRSEIQFRCWLRLTRGTDGKNTYWGREDIAKREA